MQARERYEQIEEQILSPYAALASRSKGRDREELHAITVPRFRGIAIGCCIANRSDGSSTKHRCFCLRKATITGRV